MIYKLLIKLNSKLKLLIKLNILNNKTKIIAENKINKKILSYFC